MSSGSTSSYVALVSVLCVCVVCVCACVRVNALCNNTLTSHQSKPATYPQNYLDTNIIIISQ